MVAWTRIRASRSLADYEVNLAEEDAALVLAMRVPFTLEIWGASTTDRQDHR